MFKIALLSFKPATCGNDTVPSNVVYFIATNIISQLIDKGLKNSENYMYSDELLLFLFTVDELIKLYSTDRLQHRVLP